MRTKNVRYTELIKLSKLTDYAVVTLAAMARSDEALLSASALADMTTLPEPTISKILKLLSKSNVVESVRGAKGGYGLAKPADKLLISDVIAAIEGPIALTSCVSGSTDSCAIESVCQLNGRWNIVNKAIKTALESVTLADMMPSIPAHVRKSAEEGRVSV